MRYGTYQRISSLQVRVGEWPTLLVYEIKLAANLRSTHALSRLSYSLPFHTRLLVSEVKDQARAGSKEEDTGAPGKWLHVPVSNYNRRNGVTTYTGFISTSLFLDCLVLLLRGGRKSFATIAATSAELRCCGRRCGGSQASGGKAAGAGDGSCVESSREAGQESPRGNYWLRHLGGLER